MRISTLLLVFGLLMLGFTNAYGQSPACGIATEFCAENGLSFPAGTNAGDAPPGNDYGCLSTAPNPAWYYMSTTAAGTATVTLNSSPAVDIDFALWGPFTSLGDAYSNCGSLAGPVSCSYSTSPNETVVINSGGPGEFYLLLITNFSNTPTDISGASTSTILGCNVCIAEGGILSPQNQAGCIGSLDPIEVDFGSFTPDPATMGYTLVVTDPAGNITTEYPFITTLSPALLGFGTFTVCGIGYELGSGEPATFVGQNFNSISADLASATPSFCGDPSENCVTITVVPNPIPTIVIDSVCIGAEEPNCPLINGEYICDPGSGTFTIQNAFDCDSLITYIVTPRNSIITSDSVQLCSGQAYEYDGTDYFAPSVVTIMRPAGPAGGCDTTVFLLLQLDPLLAVIDPPVFTLTCQQQSITLNNTGSSTGPNISYVWESSTGPIGTGNSVTVSDAGTYTLTVTRVNPNTGATCEVSASAVIIELPGETGMPTITGPTALCANEVGAFTALHTGIYAPYTYAWTVEGPGSNITSQVNDALSVSWAGAGTYEVCVVATGTCGPTDETCVNVVVAPEITANAGDDETICGLTTTVTGSPTGGTWTPLPGPDGTATVSSPTASSTGVSVANAGIYAFQYEIPGACNTPDTVEITFGNPLLAGTVSETCNAATLAYTVSFTFSGGTPPFVATGTPATITGQTFTSNPLASGSNYDIIILDAANCIIQITGSETCDCTTDAGDMDSAVIEVCAPDDLTAVDVTGAVNDGNDVGIYVLHTNAGASLGTVLQVNTTPTFSFGGSLLPNVTYYVSYVIGNNNGSNQPDPSDPCYAVAIGQPVRWIQAPPAFAGDDAGVCGLSIGLNATGTPGRWTGPATVTFSNPNSPTASATVAAPGVYSVIWNTGAPACADQDEVELSFFAQPTATDDFDCEAGAALYDLTITAAGGVAPYTVDAAFVTGGTSPNFTAILPVGVPYSYTIVDANGCRSVVYSGNPNCDCESDAGAMPQTLLQACVDETIQAGTPTGENLDANDVAAYVLHDASGNSLGNLFQRNATGLFAFAAPMLANVTYYVSYEVANDNGTGNPDLSDPCYDLSAGQPVRWNQAETADAGSDDETCLTSLALSANNSVGSWTAPAGVTLSDNANPNATATASTPGTYTLTWATSTQGCTDTDEVQVSFFAAPTASTTPSCDPGDSFYRLAIVIAGGVAPYTINGIAASGTGNNFNTQLPSGVAYSFTVTDANGCESLPITGTFDCSCETVAPQLASGQSACVGEAITLANPTGGVNDGNDVDQYVLYAGDVNVVTTVLATNSTPSFAYDPTYQPGVNYYITVRRGDNDGAGNPDLSDPCLNRSNGVPVVWEALPEIVLADLTICETDDAIVDYTYTGLVPATLVATVNGSNQIFAITAPTGTINFGTASGLITVISITEDSGCENDGLTETATVSRQSLSDPQIASTPSLCNSDVTGAATTIDLNSLLISGGAGTWSSPDVPSAVTGSIFSADGLAPGAYTITYTTTPTGNCPAAVAVSQISVRDCSCPNLTIQTPAPLCSNDAFFDLNPLLEEAQTGVWSIITSPTGSQPATISGSTFNGTGADPGYYRIRFTLTLNNIAGCPDTNSIGVRLSAEPLAGSSIGDLSFCESEIGTINLASQLTGQSAGGTWRALTGGDAALSGSQLIIDDLPAGNYSFEYAIAAPAPCPPVSATVDVIITPLPAVDAGGDQILTCALRSVELGVPASSGVTYAWTANGNATILSTNSRFTADRTGLYTITATNITTGCTNLDQAEIVANNDVPLVGVDLQPISCAGEGDGAITIGNIDGGQSPFTVRLNGTDIGNQRVFTSLGAGAYQIEVTDANGCTANPLRFDITEPLPVNVDLLTNINSTGVGSGEIAFQDTVLLQAFTTGDSVAVQWSPAEFVACDTCATTYGLPPSTLIYAVTVTTPEGCSDQASVQVIVRRDRPVYFPTGFSPNNDENNDWFYPQAREGLIRKVNSLIVMDRWGEQIFTRRNFDANQQRLGWDGTFQGDELNPQVFVYVAEIEFSDGVTEIFKGDIALIK